MESYQPGQEIENHRLLERIEEGDGNVWKADFLGQIVALKLLSEEVCEERKSDIETLYKLSHLAPPSNRYFIPFEHLQLFGPHRYIRMKWIEGISLANYLKSPPKEVNKMLPLAKQILKGLEIIHHQKVAHLHLTPQNIFLPYGGTPQLMNLQHLPSKKTSHSASLEKDYLAPECLSSDPKGTPASDIFSFGKILYVLLTGASPASMEPLATFSNLHIPEKLGIETFLQKCVIADPSARFQNATQALEAFDNLHYEVRRKSDAKWEPALLIPMVCAILFVMLYMMPNFLVSPQDNPEIWYIRAEEAFEIDKDYQKALSLYEKALPLYRSDYRIYREMGWCHYYLNQFEASKDALKKSLESSPDQGDSWYALGLACENIDIEEAENAYLQALKCQPPFLKSYEKIYLLFQKKLEQHLAQTEIQKLGNTYLEAQQLFQKSQITEAKATFSGFILLGRSFSQIQKVAEANTLFQLAHQLQPENGEALFYLGALWETQDSQKAISWYREATKAPIPYRYAYVSLGNISLKEWEHLLAREEKTNSLRDPTQEIEWKKNKAHLLQKAESTFLNALQKESFPEAHLGLGQVYFHLEQYSKSLFHHSQISAESIPSHYSQALFSIALCYHKLHENTKSQEYLAKLRRIHPEKATELEKLLNF